MSGTAPESRKTRRRLLKTMPVPVEETNFFWRHDHPELKGLSRAEQVLLITQTSTWRDVIRPACEAVDDKHKPKRGPQRQYTAEQLEIMLLYGVAWGEYLPERVRELLAGDREPEAKKLLGFLPPMKERKGQKRVAGVPSTNTIRRHRRRFTDARRAEMWERAHAELVDCALEEPALQDGLRELYMDGMAIFTHHKAPRYKRKRSGEETRELLNPVVYEDPDADKPKRISGYTAPEAGFRYMGDDQDHPAGHGWNLVPIIAAQGLPLAYTIDKLNLGDRAGGYKTIDAYGERVAPRIKRLRDDELSVGITDAGFNSAETKRRFHEAGVAPSVHQVSGTRRKLAKGLETEEARREATEKLERMIAEDAPANDIDELKKRLKAAEEIAKLRAIRRSIQHHPNWKANDLREIFCVCGAGRVARRAFRDKRGVAVMSLEGSCENCGPCTIQAGQWKRVKNAPKTENDGRGGDWYMKMLKGDHPDDADWSFGNYLTLLHPDSAVFSDDRFGRNEGFNAAIKNRFGVGRDKCWHRTRGAVAAHVGQAMCMIVGLSIARAQALGGARIVALPKRASGAPPGSLPQAA
jgi:hypothetical protein